MGIDTLIKLTACSSFLVLSSKEVETDNESHYEGTSWTEISRRGVYGNTFVLQIHSQAHLIFFLFGTPHLYELLRLYIDFEKNSLQYIQ